jgi:CubicO group peptidase (beta-lactamase class C family)
MIGKIRRGGGQVGLVAAASAALWLAMAADGSPPATAHVPSGSRASSGESAGTGPGPIVERDAAVLPNLDTKGIDAAFAVFDRPESPGCAAGVMAGGRIAYARGYGLASLEQQVPITPRTVFDLGSTSKQITSASVALLVLDGKLTLDDDVRKYVPELPAYGPTITVRRLLDHTSGLRDYTDVLSFDGHHEEDLTTTAEGLEAMTRQKELNFHPGREFRYTNTGHFLASILVQRISGKTLRAFAQERIFDPLGMNATTYFDDHTLVVPRRATGYAPREGGGFETSMSDWEQVGDGGVQSSIEDLAKWADNLETAKVGGQALIDMMHTAGRLNDGTPTGYGLGLFLRTHRGLKLVTHGGAWAGYRANLMRIPEHRVAAVVLCNIASANTERLGLAAIDAALDALPAAERPPAEHAIQRPGAPVPPLLDPSDAPRRRKRKPAPASTEAPDASTLESLAGTFYDLHQGQTVQVVYKDGVLRLDDLELVPDGGMLFHVKDGAVQLQYASPGGRVLTIEDPDDDAPSRAYSRAMLPIADPGAPAYVGTYASEEIKAPCEVNLGKDGLALRCGGGEEGALRPLARGLYDVGWGIARFGMQPQGKPQDTLTLTTRGMVELTLDLVHPSVGAASGPANPPKKP